MNWKFWKKDPAQKEAARMKKRAEEENGLDDTLQATGWHDVDPSKRKKKKDNSPKQHKNLDKLEEHRHMLNKTLEEAVDESGRKYNRVKDMPYGLIEGVPSGLDIEVYDTPENYVGAGGQSVVLKGKINHNAASYLYSFVRLYGHEGKNESANGGNGKGEKVNVDNLAIFLGAAKRTFDYQAVKQSLDDLESKIKELADGKKAAEFRKWEKNIVKTGEFQKIKAYVDERIGHLFPGGECAVKFSTVDETDPERARELRGQLERELNAMPGVQNPYLAYTFAQGKIPNGGTNVSRYFIATEYVKQISEIRKDRMTYEEKMGVGIQLLRCLEDALWSRNIIHRDLKPDNVLLYLNRKKGEEFTIGAKLTDTGLIKTIREETKTFNTAEVLLKGTLVYLSPERVRAKAAANEEVQEEGKTKSLVYRAATSMMTVITLPIRLVLGRHKDEKIKVTWKSDLYSAGATLYNYLTGLVPTETGYYPSLAEQHTLALCEGSLMMRRPSSTEQLKELLKEQGAKCAKEAGEYVDLVLAAMMHNDEDNRFYERGECEKDLESVMKGNAPRIILKHLESRSLNKDWYVNQVFKPGDKEGFLKRNWRKIVIGAAGAAALAGMYFADPEGTKQTIKEYLTDPAQTVKNTIENIENQLK